MARPLLLLLALCGAAVCRAQGGVLVVASDPSQAVVEVDSVRADRSPGAWPVEAGARLVRVLYAGYAPFAQTVTVAAGDTLVVRAVLVRQTGQVVVRGLPPGAATLINGASDVGGAVPTGTAMVVVTVPGGRQLRVVARVEDGAETVVDYRPRTFDASGMVMAALLPGSAAMRGGRPVAGGAVAVSFAAGASAALLAGGEARRAARATDEAYSAYLRETTEAGAVAAWTGVEREVAREHRARRLVGAGLTAAALAYAVGIADAVVHHVRPPGLRARAPRAALTRGPAGGVGAGLALSF